MCSASAAFSARASASGRSSTSWYAAGPWRPDKPRREGGPLLRRELLSYSIRDGAVIPRFLGLDDVPWLRALLDEVERFAGRREAELDERLRVRIADGVDPRK